MYKINWIDTELFFYRGMSKGWPSGNPQHAEILALPGHRVYRYRENDLLLVDMWTHTPLSPRSAGTTTIYKRFDIDDHPIWQMHYWGAYEKVERDLVKLALRFGYDIM